MVVKCANGHFYDSEKTRECPYCAKRHTGKTGFTGINGESIEYSGEPVHIPYGGENNRMPFGDSSESVTEAFPGNRFVEIGSGSGGRQHNPGLRGDTGVTVALFPTKKSGQACVTGWLVCIEGPDKGRDYRIYHGQNWVGKSYDSDIILNENHTVSEHKHCSLVYDGKSNQFFVVKGDATLTYLNDKVLQDASKLSMGDILGIGNSKYEFIPYCREGHTWKTEENN